MRLWSLGFEFSKFLMIMVLKIFDDIHNAALHPIFLCQLCIFKQLNWTKWLNDQVDLRSGRWYKCEGDSSYNISTGSRIIYTRQTWNERKLLVLEITHQMIAINNMADTLQDWLCNNSLPNNTKIWNICTAQFVEVIQKNYIKMQAWEFGNLISKDLIKLNSWALWGSAVSLNTLNKLKLITDSINTME